MSCVTALTLSMYLIFGGSCHKYDFCFDKHVFIMTKHFFCHDKSRQNFCHDKIMFAATKIFCHDKHNFVMTKLQHTFVVTKDMFCCNKHVFCHDKQVCHDKFFVATKMILVAAPANDRILCAHITHGTRLNRLLAGRP